MRDLRARDRNEECRLSLPVEDALVSPAGSGMALPLLPTLVVAVIVSAASFLCQTPSVVAPEPLPTSVSAVEPAPDQTGSIEAAAPYVPAAFAFRDQFPLREDVVRLAETRAEPAHRRPGPSIATVKPPRRPDVPRSELARSELARAEAGKGESGKDGSTKVGSGEIEGPKAVAAKAPEPFTLEAVSEEGLIPDLAIPFAPAISALTRAGRYVGTQSAAVGAEALALGGAVTGLVDRLPIRP